MSQRSSSARAMSSAVLLVFSVRLTWLQKSAAMAAAVTARQAATAALVRAEAVALLDLLVKVDDAVACGG
eukprot:1235882-Prymnesium_polylepis.1